MGYDRGDGRFGTRNYIAIISTVNCSASTSKYISERVRASGLLRQFPNVDGVVAITHKGGVTSHLFTSPNVGILGPRLTVLGSKGAYVKHGIDPQEEALLAGGTPGTPGWGEEPESAWGKVGAGDDAHALRSEPGNYLAFYSAVAAAIRNGTEPPVTTEQGIALMELLDAARLSARDGRVVEMGT